jgi:hypothetical protein
MEGAVFLFATPWTRRYVFDIWALGDLFQVAILSWFFYLIIEQRSLRIVIQALFVFYVIFFSLNFRTDNEVYRSTVTVISYVVILLLCLFYIANILKPSANNLNILSPIFIIAIALLSGVSCTLFLHIVANHLTLKELGKYWEINYYAGILLNLLLCWAFVLFYRQNKSKTPENHIVDYTSPSDR